MGSRTSCSSSMWLMPVGINPRESWLGFCSEMKLFMRVCLLQLSAYIKRNIQLITGLIIVIALINLSIMKKAHRRARAFNKWARASSILKRWTGCLHFLSVITTFNCFTLDYCVSVFLDNCTYYLIL